jgi:hypothetical protein
MRLISTSITADRSVSESRPMTASGLEVAAPQRPAAAGIDEVRGDPHEASVAVHPAVQRVANPELVADLPQFPAAAGKLRRDGGRDHRQSGHARNRAGHLRGHRGGQRSALRGFGRVRKRQDDERLRGLLRPPLSIRERRGDDECNGSRGDRQRPRPARRAQPGPR